MKDLEYQEKTEVSKDELKKKKILLYLGLILIVILLFNDNNNPTILGDRILSFITSTEGNIFSGLIINIGFYFILREFNNIKERFFTKSFFRRVLTVIIVLPLIQSLWNYPTKFIKRFESGLESIYLYRDNTNFKGSGNSEVINLEGRIKIQNLGEEEQRFYVKVDLPKLITSEEKYFELKEEYIVKPKESMYIEINEEIPSYLKNGQGFSGNIVDNIFLFNEKEEVVFKYIWIK